MPSSSPLATSFTAAHQGGSGPVWIAVVQDATGEVVQMAVFSSYDGMNEWCDDLVSTKGDLDIIASPFLVDEPEFGLLPPEKRQ